MPADLLELLTSGQVDAFNTARDRRGTLDLFAADLSNLSLAGVDFSGANLQKADLTATDLTGAVLAKADLSGADLTGAVLHGAMALRSRWKEAYLGDADLGEADLQGADLSEADLTNAKLGGARMAGARLKGVTGPGAVLTGVDLTEAKLSGANLQGADLSGAVLREADLSRANLGKANLTGADLGKARLAGTAMKEADLSGANFQHADLTAADLSGAIVKAADFTRADLTEAVLEGVNLADAVLTYAEIEAGAAPEAEEPAAKLQVEDASIAISNNHVGLLWENDEGGGKNKLRVIVAPLDKPFDGRSIALPLPPDAVLSRALVPTADGFCLIAVVERPGGLVASVSELSLSGKLSPARSIKLDYTPAVRPVARPDPAGTLLFGISREGPGLQVHRVEGEGLTRVHRSGMSTVRGFAGSLYPIVLSKGGILVNLSAEGPGQPMRAPGAFPGRVCAATPMGTGLVLAWLEEGQSGFHLAFVKPGESPEDMRLLPKIPVGSLDLLESSGRVWVALTREDPRGRAPASAWALRLPEADPIPVVNTPDVDVDDVRFCLGTGTPMVAVTTLAGTVLIATVEPGGAKIRWRMG